MAGRLFPKSSPKRRRADEACYLCGQPKYSIEHIPAKAFFPECGDIGEDVRQNLNTVPACREHNEAYSLDDQYAAYVLASGANDGPDGIGYRHFSTKVMRATTRRPKLAEAVWNNLCPIRTPEGDTASFVVDLERMSRVMRRIACGLFYEKTGWRLPPNDLKVYMPRLRAHDDLSLPFQEMIPAFESMPHWVQVSTCDPRIFVGRLYYDRSMWKHCAFNFWFYNWFPAYLISAGRVWLGSWLPSL